MAVVYGNVNDGLNFKTLDGKPARLGIIDEQGRVVESGPEVAAEVWNVTLNIYKNFRLGQGHYKVFTEPPGKMVV